MGWWDDFTGKSGADAAERASNISAQSYREAASDTYGKQRAAIERLLGYGNEYRDAFTPIAGSYDPFISYAQEAGSRPVSGVGPSANVALERLISNPESVRSLPGYRFAQDEGIQALDRSANARHMSASGRASKDLLRFSMGLGDQTYGTQLARLMGLSRLGMDEERNRYSEYMGGLAPLSARNAALGTGLTGQMGARTTAYGGDMTSAGTQGQGMIGAGNATSQGMIAAANAEAKGAQNLWDGGMKIAGMATSALTGMPSFGGGSSYGGGQMGDGWSTNNFGGSPNWARPGGSWYSR